MNKTECTELVLIERRSDRQTAAAAERERRDAAEKEYCVALAAEGALWSEKYEAGLAAGARRFALVCVAFWLFVGTMTILIGGFIGGLMGVPVVVGIMVFGFLVMVLRKW